MVVLMLITGGCSTADKRVTSKEQYPVKPITILVPYAAGGTTDIVARTMEKKAIQHLGQPLTVMNKPGGSGTIGLNELVASKPDGYTIGVGTIGMILQPLYGQSKYNYPTALEPLAKVMNTPIIMTVSANSKWNNLSEFIAYAKAHPSEIKYGHNGLGGGVYVAAEMFEKAAGIRMEQVPFRGDPEALAALLGNHVDVTFTLQGTSKEYVKSGKIKILAVAEPQRLKDADFKDVPTFKEQGFDVEFCNWQCIVAPKDMPSFIKNTLANGIKEILNDPEFQENMRSMGFEVDYLGPEDCLKQWAHDNEYLGKVVQETGIAAQVAAQRK